MKFLSTLTIFILVTANFCCAQYYDLGTYRHTINYPDHKVSFHVLMSEKSLEGFDVDKKYTWYSGNQISVTQGGFSGKLLHGAYSDHYNNKNLKEQGDFDNGLKVGVWRAWQEDGTLISSLHYSQGLLNGPFQKYDKTGALSEEGRYAKGLLSGKLKKYTGTDNPQVIKYSRGKVVVEKPWKITNWIKTIFSKKENPKRAKKNNKR